MTEEKAMSMEPTPAQSDSSSPFVCPECGREIKYFARGLCQACYAKKRRAKKIAEEAIQAEPAVIPVEVRTSTAATMIPVMPETSETPLAKEEPPFRRIYLACPYSHEDAIIQKERAATATRAAQELIRQGYTVFSPLTHGHTLCEGSTFPKDFAFWGMSCLSFVEHWATDVYVLMVPGWDSSTGVCAEVEAATHKGLPVVHVLPLPVASLEA